MKKLLFITVVLLCTRFCLNAQEKGTFEGGLFIGYNSATVRVNTGTADLKTGTTIGASREYYFSDRWGLHFEVAYSPKGWSNGFLEDLDNSTTIITDYRLKYITIPVTFNLHFGKTKGWHFNFGPYIGFLTKAEVEKTELDVTDLMSSTDFGLALGIGYKFRLSEFTKLQLDYGTQTGFVNVFEVSAEPVYNSSSRFNISLLFDL
tara:strand:+ start:10242 stop:10856 length:615 start_codon:yes stop_codon:yes gene_type:complete